MIYFTRHGISEANELGVYAGSKNDSKLTAEGARKVAQLAKDCQALNITTIYVSSLARSIESGEIVVSLLTPKPRVIKDARTNELDFGKLVGQKYTDFDTEEAYEKYGIEPKEAFYARAREFYDEKIKEASKGNILLVGHCGFGMMLYAIVNDIEYKDYNKAFKPLPGKIYSLSK